MDDFKAIFALVVRHLKNVKINDYNIYHWCFHCAVLHELNPVYEGALSKMNERERA